MLATQELLDLGKLEKKNKETYTKWLSNVWVASGRHISKASYKRYQSYKLTGSLHNGA